MSEIYLSYCLNIFSYLTYAMQCKVFSHEILCCVTLHCVLCYIALHYKIFNKITDTAKNFIGRHLLHKLLWWVVIIRLNISIFIYELCAMTARSAFSTCSGLLFHKYILWLILLKWFGNETYTGDWHHSIGRMVFDTNSFKPTNYVSNK